MKQTILCCLLTAVMLLTACRQAPETTTNTSALATQSEAVTTQATYDPDIQTEPVSVTYRTSGEGTIAGATMQTLTPQSPVASRVEAVPEFGYRFSHWSDGSEDPLRFGDSFPEDTVITAYFVEDTLSLPAVSLTTEIPEHRITTDTYVNGSVSISGCAEDYQLTDLATEVRGRGHGSWTYEKKGWKLKLSSGKSLLGLGKGKSREWVLIANQVDRSLLRNAAATWIQNQLSFSYVADYAFVDLYLNGQYMGVYQLYEQIEEDENKVSVPMGTPEDVSYFAEITTHAETPKVEIGKHRYEIHSDLPNTGSKAYLAAIEAHLLTCFNAVKSGNEAEIASLIDLNSVVDAYIVEELTKNLDTGWDSFYLYRTVGGKLTFGPVWDFDMSSGNVKADRTSICYTSFSEPQGFYAGNLAAGGDRQQNQWFQLLVQYDWFNQMVAARWQEVSSAMEALPQIILQTGNAYQEEFERNFQRWKILTKRLTTEADVILTLNTYEKQVEYLADWYAQRIQWLNEEWGA